MPGDNGQKNLKKHVTEKDLAETRSKILKAAEELDQQIDERLEWAKNWKATVGNYPLEAATGLFTIGFVMGSGILAEILGAMFLPRTTGKRKEKRRRSTATRTFSLVRRLATPVITMIVLDRTKKQAG